MTLDIKGKEVKNVVVYRDDDLNSFNKVNFIFR